VMGQRSGDRALLVGDSAHGARLLEPETPEKIVPGEMWVTSGDDGQMPLGVNVGRARLENGEWRIDLSMNEAPVDYVRLVPPPDFAKPEAAPVIDQPGLAKPAGVAANTSSPASAVATSAPAGPKTPVSASGVASPGAKPIAPPKPPAPKPSTAAPASKPEAQAAPSQAASPQGAPQ